MGDRDGDGVITSKELSDLLPKYNAYLSLQPNLIDRILLADRDKNHVLDEGEMKKLLQVRDVKPPTLIFKFPAIVSFNYFFYDVFLVACHCTLHMHSFTCMSRNTTKWDSFHYLTPARPPSRLRDRRLRRTVSSPIRT